MTKAVAYLPFELDRVAIKARPCHWISTPDGDLGTEWCPDCGRFKVRNLRRHDRRRKGDYILDGGWRTEHDTFPICQGCSAHLDGSLTEYGARQEADYYRENGLSTRADVDALYLAEIIGALGENDEDALMAAKLARRLLRQNKPKRAS